jgi:hypothetical protein
MASGRVLGGFVFLGKMGFMSSRDHQGPDRKRGDLLEAFAAYDLWSFLAWQDIKIKDEVIAAYHRRTVATVAA